MNIGSINYLMASIVDIIGGIFEYIWLVVKYAFARVFYGVISALLMLLDLVQDIFRRFAGIGDDSTDFVSTILNSDVIRNVLFSIMILAVILLFIFTVFAIVRMHYQAESKDSVSAIIGRSIRAVFGFILVPVVCVAGVYLSNIVLQAVDSATAGQSNTTMSGLVFKSCAYNANYLRSTTMSNEEKIEYANDYADMFSQNGLSCNRYTGSANDEAAEQYIENMAELIDYSFSCGFANIKGKSFKIDLKLVPGWYWVCTGTGIAVNSIASAAIFNWNTAALIEAGVLSGGDMLQTSINKYDTLPLKPYSELNNVSVFYDIAQIDYVMLIVSAIFMGWALCNITFGLMKRIFMLSYLYVISPALLSLYPLDSGSAIGKWKGDFIGYTVMAYSSVAGLNLFLSILPIVNKVQPYGKFGSGNFFNTVLQLLVSIVGIFTVKEIIGVITGYIGGKNALEEGTAMQKSVTGAIGKTIATGAKVTGGVFGAIQSGKYNAEKDPNKKGKYSLFDGAKDAIKGVIETTGMKSKPDKAFKEGREAGFGANKFNPSNLFRDRAIKTEELARNDQAIEGIRNTITGLDLSSKFKADKANLVAKAPKAPTSPKAPTAPTYEKIYTADELDNLRGTDAYADAFQHNLEAKDRNRQKDEEYAKKMKSYKNKMKKYSADMAKYKSDLAAYSADQQKIKDIEEAENLMSAGDPVEKYNNAIATAKAKKDPAAILKAQKDLESDLTEYVNKLSKVDANAANAYQRLKESYNKQKQINKEIDDINKDIEKGGFKQKD